MLEPTQLRWKCGQVRVTRLKTEDELYTRATVKTDTSTNDKGSERVFIVQHSPSDAQAPSKIVDVGIPLPTTSYALGTAPAEVDTSELTAIMETPRLDTPEKYVKLIDEEEIRP